MLHKYYLSGISNRFNLKFCSNTSDEGIWTLPDLRYNLKDLLNNSGINELDKVLYGFKQYLYLEKSDNTNRYWKVIIGIWNNKYDYESNNHPKRIIRITTDNFEYLVKDKYTNRYFDELPIETINDENIIPFY